MKSKEKKYLKRFMALVISFAMIFSAVPSNMITARAAELEDATEEITEEVSEEISEDTSSIDDTTEEVTEETSEDTTEEVTEETTEEVTEESTEETTEEDVIIEDVDPDALTPNYLTFTAVEANSTVSFSWLEGSDFAYSLDGGNTWEEYVADTVITLAKVGDSVQFKGKNIVTSTKWNLKNVFEMTGKIAASGSVTSLTDENGGDSNVKLTEACYGGMFYDCTSLVKAPELPATTLADGCYASMFSGCTSLKEVPELPATTLADNCYGAYGWHGGMFENCTSLVKAPKLPATTLADWCYASMFRGCTSLKEVPELPATTLADSCYHGMFIGCTSLKEVPELPATTLAEHCYTYMFYDCTSLVKAPELPATTISDWCYYGMFRGCTSLKEVPELPATILADYCYNFMFDGCTSLKEVPELPATTLADGCYEDMFKDCTSLVEAPELPVTKLANYCYASMFDGCTSLVKAPKLPATILAHGCYDYMFYDCTSLVKAPELPATTLSDKCYYGMFRGCTSLKEVPELPATTLAYSCYYEMFAGCSSLQLKKIKDNEHQLAWKIPATIESETWNHCMFADCPGVEIEEPELGVTYYQLGKEPHVHTYKTKITKANLTKNGSIKKVCTGCGVVASTETIYYPKTISLSKKNFTYNGKAQKPTVSVVDANNKTVAAANYDITYATGLKNVGEYKVTITFKGNYTGTVTKTFTINPKKTSFVSVKSKPKQMTVKWKKQAAQVTGYEIQYSTNASFKKGVKKVTVTSAKTTSKTIKKLKSGKKYYVRIRTYKKGGSKKYYSAWSAKKSVKVK